MKQTPLFANHQALAAEMVPMDGWLLPNGYGSTTDEEISALRTGVGLIDLAAVGTVTLAGPDARRFCNGMFTNIIKSLQPGEGNRSAMCDDRGRIQGLIDVYCTGDESFLGVLEGVSAAWFEERYQMYIVFDDVQMGVSDDAPWVLSLQGPESKDLLEALGLPIPTEPHAHLAIASQDSTAEIRVCRKNRAGHGGFDLLLPTDALEPTWEALVKAGAVPAGQAALDSARIVAGRARWPIDGTEKSLVHELRLDDEVCNFDKGCYLGQEVINRIDVKGQVAKKLMGIVVDEDALPPIGAEVKLGDNVVGRVTSTTRFDGRVLALGVIRKTAWEIDLAVVIEAGGRAVPGRIQPLPFA